MRLGSCELEVLEVLSGPCKQKTVREIAQETKHTHGRWRKYFTLDLGAPDSTVRKAVKRLEDKGLVRRCDWLRMLTDAGREVVKGE